MKRLRIYKNTQRTLVEEVNMMEECSRWNEEAYRWKKPWKITRMTSGKYRWWWGVWGWTTQRWRMRRDNFGIMLMSSKKCWRRTTLEMSRRMSRESDKRAEENHVEDGYKMELEGGIRRAGWLVGVKCKAEVGSGRVGRGRARSDGCKYTWTSSLIAFRQTCRLPLVGFNWSRSETTRTCSTAQPALPKCILHDAYMHVYFLTTSCLQWRKGSIILSR